MIPTLLPWIDKCFLDYESLGENPKSVEAGMIDIRINNEYTNSNPEFAEYIKDHIDKYIYNTYIWQNPALFDWLIEKYPDRDVNYDGLLMNTNPNVIKFLLDRGMPITKHLSRHNPIAFKYFLETLSQEEVSVLYGNSAATDYLGDFNGHGKDLSSNSHPRAIEYLRTHQDEINWYWFSMNPGIFEYRVDPELVAALSE